MAEKAQYEELIRQFSAFGAVRREMGRLLPPDCPGGALAVLALLGQYGDMRMSKLAELLAVDMSVTSRHVAHVAERGWIDRFPDPADRRSRILRLTPEGQDRLDDVAERTSRMLADRLSDWSDDEVGRLSELMARLRASFDDCRVPTARPPAPTGNERSTRTPAITT